MVWHEDGTAFVDDDGSICVEYSDEETFQRLRSAFEVIPGQPN